MVGMVATGPLPNSSIDHEQQEEPTDNRRGNTHLTSPEPSTPRSVRDSPQSTCPGSAAHRLPPGTQDPDLRSDNLQCQLDNKRPDSTGVRSFSDSLSADCDNRIGRRDSGSYARVPSVDESGSHDDTISDSLNDNDSSAGGDPYTTHCDENSNSTPSYQCNWQVFRASKRSYDIIGSNTYNPNFDSSRHHLLDANNSECDKCEQNITFHGRQKSTRSNGNKRNIAFRVKWDCDDQIPIHDLEARLLPNIWRLNTPAESSLPSPGLFRRQYSRKCEAADVTKTPLVLYAMRKSSKVYASMIRLDPDRDQFSEVGPQIVIPVNYPGWFQHIENNNVNIHSLPTIGDVASAELSEFLVHKPITAFRYVKCSSDGDKLYSEVKVPAGEVLTTRSVLTEWLSEESLQKGCLCIRKKKHKTDASYLKVRDSSSKRLLIPFETEGGFSEVGQRGGETRPDASYQLTDIARWVQMPVELKLVCGELPEGLEQNTGLFRLEQLSFESSAFGCTIAAHTEQERQMVEFPVDAGMEFSPCKNWSDLQHTDEVQCALVQCHKDMEDFVTSMKVVKDVDVEDEPLSETVLSNPLGTSTVERALPPTPLLPCSSRKKKPRGWSWAKSLLMRYRKSNGSHEIAASESSDYEVIPFYLRTVNNQDEQDRNAKICDSLERTNFAQYNSACDSSDKDIESLPADSSTLPSSPPPPPKFKVRNTRTAGTDGAHDENGYLLPVEARETLKERMISTPQSPHSGKNASMSFCSIGQDTCSSATITRELDMTVGALNKSTETLLAPPSSGTVRTYINSVSGSEYSPAAFDQQRLDSFLSDSIHELRRRQSRELLTQITELTEQKQQKLCPTCTSPAIREQGPSVHNQDDVNMFLDKIFDYDRMSDDKGQSSQSSSTTTGVQTRRSMSVPESMLPRLDHIHRGSRQCLECGYQTLDSGIWLSPRSGASDPYRQDRDSATYRSTSDCSWVPPENIEPLTVEEVGLSLRYIGMKDYIVTRFCDEQIDGKQLTELTPDLILEGFPDLNALDRKKLADFIKGWRPKKWGYIPAE